jgi:hypothetical protein
LICVARLDRLHACEQRVTSKRDDSGELQSPKNCCRARLTVIGAVICLQLTAENYSRPAAPMLASSRYSPAVPIQLAKHARQLNLSRYPQRKSLEPSTSSRASSSVVVNISVNISRRTKLYRCFTTISFQKNVF